MDKNTKKGLFPYGLKHCVICSYRFARNSYCQKYCKPCDANMQRQESRENYHRYRKAKLKKIYTLRKQEPWRNTYINIFKRCKMKSHMYYKYYGGRGIKMLITAPELKRLWFRDKAYAMQRPSIDRKKNDGNYTYANCRYLELSENVRRANKRRAKCLK